MLHDRNETQGRRPARMSVRYGLFSLALSTALLGGCALSPESAEDGTDEPESVVEAEEAVTLVATLHSGAGLTGNKLALTAGKTYVGPLLAPVGDNHARSLTVPSGLSLTVCRSPNPTSYDIKTGVGNCRRIDPAATDGGGIFSTDGGGIFSTDGGGIYSTDPGGIFSLGAPALLDAAGTLTAPALDATWMDSISWVQVRLSP